MKIFEILGKILDFIRDILVGFVILTVIAILGIVFGIVVFADGILGLFSSNKSQKQNNDEIEE